VLFISTILVSKPRCCWLVGYILLMLESVNLWAFIRWRWEKKSYMSPFLISTFFLLNLIIVYVHIYSSITLFLTRAVFSAKLSIWEYALFWDEDKYEWIFRWVICVWTIRETNI